MNMNHGIIVLTFMILGHLLADYPLQGWLATAKSKLYWKQSGNEKTKFDYIPALICHAAMWGILIFIPLVVWFPYEYMVGWFWIALPINILIHAIVDDLKANKQILNLWQDQLIHLGQIIVTWVIWLLAFWL